MVYLDNAATTKPKTKVITTIMQDFIKHWGNPSSKHKLGADAKKILETDRAVVANFIGAKASEIIFTSGACESNSLALLGSILNNSKYQLITSTIEHKSIKMLTEDYDTLFVNVDNGGFVYLKQLETLCQSVKQLGKIPLVSIQWANNEIGTVQDMEKISEIVHEYGGILHTDATQLIPDRPISVDGIDMLSFSGQKFGCPKGIGVLYVRTGIELHPLIYGSQERGRRGGTENVAFIDGLRMSLQEFEYPDVSIRDSLINSILTEVDGSYLVGSIDNRLGNNVSICFPGIESNTLLQMLSNQDVYVSTGSACNSESIEPSYVLRAIDMKEEDLYSVLRFTTNNDLTQEQIDTVVNNIKDSIDGLRMMKEYMTQQ